MAAGHESRPAPPHERTLTRASRLWVAATDSSSAERAAVLFYGATLLVISLVITAMVRYAGSHPDLIEEEGRDQVVALAAQAGPNLGFYVAVLALALALLSPKIAAFGFLAIAVFAILRAGGEPSPAPSRR